MGCVFTKYRLELVKEQSSIYEIERRIDSPKAVESILKKVLNIESEPEEVFYMISLNTKKFVTGVFEVSRGTINSSIVHPREVFKRAILNNADSIILAHNHPSGDPNPSKEDVNVTKRLSEAGRIMGVKVLDHIIIGNSMFSLREKGLL